MCWVAAYAGVRLAGLACRPVGAESPYEDAADVEHFPHARGAAVAEQVLSAPRARSTKEGSGSTRVMPFAAAGLLARLSQPAKRRRACSSKVSFFSGNVHRDR